MADPRPALPARPLGRSGLTVSAIGFGAAPLGDLYARMEEGVAIGAAVAAIEQGVTLLDTSPLYGHGLSEHRCGTALRIAGREGVVLSTKAGRWMEPRQGRGDGSGYLGGLPHRAVVDYSHDGTLRSVEQSLLRLGTDRIDLLLIHRPDPLMDFDEVAEAFTRLQQAGKVRHVGVSNFTRHQFECLNRRVPLATNQVEFSPMETSAMFDETFDGMQDLRIAPMVWSPLGGGRLFTSDDARAVEVRGVIQEIADRMEKPFASVLFAWIMQLPSRPIPLTGTGRFEAIREAVAGASFRLERGDWFRILRAARGHEVA